MASMNLKSPQKIVNYQKYFFILYAAIAFVLYFKLGEQPLQMEEPRRAMVALEMELSGQYIAPTLYGDFYYNKPPLWNWMILSGYKIFGAYSGLAVRFFSVLSFLLMGLSIYYIGKKYISNSFGAYSSLFFLISGDILFHFSQLGEIDLFYSYITFLSLFSIFHFYNRKQLYLLFIACYFFTALGVLTKALPSLVFAGASLLVFFIYKKEFKKLFSLAHLSGLLVLVAIVGGYVYLYSKHNDPQNLLNQLWSESSNRTTSSNGVLDFLGHLILFPLDMLKNILPASVLVVFLFQKNVIKKIRSNPLIEFAFFMFLANIVLYLVSTGAKQRYIYMLYPLAIYMLVYLFQNTEKKHLQNIQRIVFEAFIYLMAVGSIALMFIDRVRELEFIKLFAIVFFLAFTFLAYLYRTRKLYRIYILIFAFVLVRMLYNFVVYPERSASHNVTILEKNHAEKIAKLTKDEDLFLYKSTFLFYRLGFYIEANRKDILQRDFEIVAGRNYLIKKKKLRGKEFEYIYRFKDKNGEAYAVVKFQ